MFDLFDRIINKIRESRLPSAQAKIKTANTPSFNLTPSTWGGEEQWLKFLVLVDGSVIPVEDSHMATISGHNGVIEPDGGIIGVFAETGGLQGRIDLDTEEMNLYYDKKLTQDQINSIIELSIKYHTLNIAAESDDGSFLLKIKSSDQLAAVLQYGPEMAESPTERYHFNLMDHLLQIREGGLDTTDEIGFIQPNGSKNILDFNKYTLHVDYAANILGKDRVEHDLVKADEILRDYCEQSGEIRYVSDYDGFSIEVFTSITPAQFRTVARMARGSDEFYWDIYTMGGEEGHGGNFISFRSFVEKHGLIQ